jgi:hypothetical protein
MIIEVNLGQVTTPPVSMMLDTDLSPGVLITLDPPLPNCILTASPGAYSAITDNQGQAFIGLPNGNYTISGLLPGYIVTGNQVSVLDNVPEIIIIVTLRQNTLISSLYTEVWAPIWESVV